MSNLESNGAAKARQRIVFKTGAAEIEACGICGNHVCTSHTGDDFYLEGTSKVVCVDCATIHAPDLVDIVVRLVGPGCALCHNPDTEGGIFWDNEGHFLCARCWSEAAAHFQRASAEAIGASKRTINRMDCPF